MLSVLLPITISITLYSPHFHTQTMYVKTRQHLRQQYNTAVFSSATSMKCCEFYLFLSVARFGATTFLMLASITFVSRTAGSYTVALFESCLFPIVSYPFQQFELFFLRRMIFNAGPRYMLHPWRVRGWCSINYRHIFPCGFRLGV